jgi:hypothetical protein
MLKSERTDACYKQIHNLRIAYYDIHKDNKEVPNTTLRWDPQSPFLNTSKYI